MLSSFHSISSEFQPGKIRALLIMVLVSLTAGCSNNYMDRVEMGDNSSSKLGHPDISVVNSSYIDENNRTHVLVIAEIVKSSLIFKNIDGEIRNNSELEIEINGKGEFRDFEAQRRFPIGLVQESPESVYDYEVIKRENLIPVDPGEYEVQVMVTDLVSGKESVVKETLIVPDPSENLAHMTNIRSYGRAETDTAFKSLNSYDISMDTDSLKFIFQVTNTETDDPMVIESSLVRFEADSSIPRPMSGRDYRNTSLEFKGIDYREFEVIQQNRRVLTETGSVIIEFEYTSLNPGNYRFLATTRDAEGKEIYRARDFSVKSSNFPAIRTPKELAKPLAYLMRKKEYEELMSMQDADSVKKAIDQYWLGNIKNSAKARQVLELYYDRVEQANLQFSNFKEGWKTDPGMIYILFGPPSFVDYGFGYMTWIYNFDTGNRSPAITFRDVQYGNSLYPFEHYLLNRDPALHGAEYKQIQAWNDGSILFLNQ